MNVGEGEIIENLDKMENAMKRVSRKKEPKLNIFAIYILVIVIISIIFYPLFPILLNYPPGSINTQFDIEFSKIAYYQQYIIVISLVIVIGYICLKLAFKDVEDWQLISRYVQTKNIEEIKKIRKKSYAIPHIVYLIQITIPIVLVGVLFIILGFGIKDDMMFFLILTAGMSFTGVVSYLFSKNYFRQVLKITFLDGLELEGRRFNLQPKIILQIFPLFSFSLMFLALVVHSGLIREKGNAMFTSYQHKLELYFKNNSFIESEAEIENFLMTIKPDNKTDVVFYIAPNGKYKTSDGSYLSKFFLKYTRELAPKYNGHTYDYYGSNIQGAIIKIPGINGDWIFGFKYKVASPETTTLIFISFISLSVFAILVISYFGKTIADDITLIASGLKEIADGEETDLNRKIAVTSNDEIGDLVKAFNKVQERERKYIQDIKNQQKVIVEREKLVSLGQMISGLTHNLKTPLMSLSVAISSLTDLVEEYQASIGDRRVTDQDHYEIAAEMGSWLTEMKPYCDYMTDVLETIKGQVAQGKTSLGSYFTIGELLKRIEIITYYELTKSGCCIDYDIEVNPDLKISGEISDLIQVLENLISNSVQAYQGERGVIKLTITQIRSILEIQVKDLGIGIPENIKPKLFKEIVTTKGKKGTGLGLYISSAIIKGKFGGEIRFSSTPGQGTVFYISIPLDVKIY